jgi:hypothetical protein
MTTDERREGGARLCRRLTDEVEKLAPEGIGRWPQTWEIVGEADAAFLAALTHWEATGDEAHKPPLREAYYSVLDAWRQAVSEYERQGAER